MDAVSFALSISTARTLIIDIKTRIADMRHGPATFQGLTNELDRLMGRIVEVETILESTPTVIPTEVSAIFKETLASVCETLIRSNSTLKNVCSKAFLGSSSGMAAKVQSVIRRATRTTTMRDAMNEIQKQVQEASTALLLLISMLVSGLKSQEQQDVLIPKLDSLRIADVYKAENSTPALFEGVHLNFSAKDTPEGILKQAVLSPDSTIKVTAAAGVLTSAHGVFGMAGVGKTIALHGLAFDAEIRRRFHDGIQYMFLGRNATLSKAAKEIARIMRLTGASALVSEVECSDTLREAVDYAVAWFKGKNILFLVDDLWPTENCPTGLLIDLRQLLRCSSESRMVITTRVTEIAESAGHVVRFYSRPPIGDLSVNIFMAHAVGDARNPDGNLNTSIETILTICAGLPMAHAVAGRAVAFLTREQGDFERACDKYAEELKNKRSTIGEKQPPRGESLNTGISVSLKLLETEYLKMNPARAPITDLTIADLYTSLCVLRYSAWIPVSTLGRMWRVDNEFALAVVRLFSGLSLCELSFRELVHGQAEEHCIYLHDLLLDFCKLQAGTSETNSSWHTQLLSGYLEPLSSSCDVTLPVEQGISIEQALFVLIPRPWWSISDDGYIHADLARHLVAADFIMELCALLLDARWMYAHAEIGGILALKSDFACLLALGDRFFPLRVCNSFELIWRAIQLSWGRMSGGQRAFQFQLCGRLQSSRADNAIVDSFLKDLEAVTPPYYLLPVNHFFPDQHGALLMEIPVGHVCCAVDSSPCGRYMVVGAGSNVIVADISTGEILKCLESHTGTVTCVSFAYGGKKIVSGSWDKSVAVWEWETSGSPLTIFRGHRDWVTGVSVNSNAGRIFSSSDDCKLRILDANTGAQIDEFPQRCRVNCVAISPDHRCVAICLANGTLKVLDSSTGETIFEDADAHEDNIISVAFSAKEQRLATGSRDKTIRVWNAVTWTSIGKALDGHTCFVYCVTFSPDGQYIASASVDCTVRLWETNTGRSVWVSPKIDGWMKCVTFSRDGERIISGSEFGIIYIWDIRARSEETEPKRGYCAWVQAVAIAHDGLQVASVSKDRTVCIWNSCDGRQIGSPLRGHADSVLCVAWSDDGQYLVSGSLDKTVRIWDVKTLSQRGDPLEGHSDMVCTVSFSSDGLRILSGSRDTTICIWDVKSGKQIGNPLQGNQRSVMAVAENADGRYIVSRDEDDLVIIWNRTGRAIVWKSQRLNNSETPESNRHGSIPRYELTTEEAEEVIRNCGEVGPQLCPKLFPANTGDVYCLNDSVYAKEPEKYTLLGTLPSCVSDWKYNRTSRVFAAGMQNGDVAICRLMASDA